MFTCCSLIEIDESNLDGLTNFGECDQFASCLTGFIDEVDRLLDTALQVEPLYSVSSDGRDIGRTVDVTHSWLRGDSCSLVSGNRHFGWSCHYSVIDWKKIRVSYLLPDCLGGSGCQDQGRQTSSEAMVLYIFALWL